MDEDEYAESDADHRLAPNHDCCPYCNAFPVNDLQRGYFTSAAWECGTSHSTQSGKVHQSSRCAANVREASS